MEYDQALIAYNQLIESNKNTSKIKYQTERHHIIPKSHNGSDEPENLVNLFHKDHFIAHYYLWKIHQDYEMSTAFFMMFAENKDKLDDSLLDEYAEEYQKAKEFNSKWQSDIRKGIDLRKNKGKKHTNETKKKMSDARSGEGNPNYGRKHSDETKAKMKESRRKRPPVSEESKAKMSKSKFGKKVHTDESKKKLSAAAKGKIVSQETREKMSIASKNGAKNRRPISEETRKKLSESQIKRWDEVRNLIPSL